MANEAHKEPTMEEILASIRKIISDDDVAAPAAEEEVETVAADMPAAEEEPFEPLREASAGDDFDDDMFGDDEDALDAELDTFEADAEEELSEPPSFEEMLGAARAVVNGPQPAEADLEAEALVAELEEEVVEEFVAEPEPEAFVEQTVAAPQEEDMQASARYQDTTLTDESTADVAANTLGKLIAKMDMSGSNTIEGLIRELLKPMMKEWLDANLPKIVEEKVEAEVQRIARMVR